MKCFFINNCLYYFCGKINYYLIGVIRHTNKYYCPNCQEYIPDGLEFAITFRKIGALADGKFYGQDLYADDNWRSPLSTNYKINSKYLKELTVIEL